MSREVKFRGWDKENKCWRYGWLTRLSEGVRKFWAIICEEPNGITRYYIHEAKSIGQYTGLKDKNGKEIFEGDILRYFDIVYCALTTEIDDTSTVVEWDDSKGMYSFYGCYGDFDGKTRPKHEVIGNIHENPELLEASKC